MTSVAAPSACDFTERASVADQLQIEMSLYEAALEWIARERIASALTVAEAANLVEKFEVHVFHTDAQLYALADDAISLSGRDLYATTLQEVALMGEFCDLPSPDNN